MDNFLNYLNNVPKLHTWDGGVTWTTGGFNSEQLNEIYIFLKNHGDGLHFIETGAGNSTLLFSFLNQTKVVSIAPDQELFDRIISCMQAYHLDPSKLQMIKDFSEWALPKLAESIKIEPIFDVCFIDGDHNYPSVFIDFFYMNYMMKKGGILFIDDLQIYSCNQLSEFLLHERDFQLVFDIGKLRGYKRTSERRILAGWKSGYNLKMMNKSKE